MSVVSVANRPRMAVMTRVGARMTAIRSNHA
jgi:hypothetical protein